MLNLFFYSFRSLSSKRHLLSRQGSSVEAEAAAARRRSSASFSVTSIKGARSVSHLPTSNSLQSQGKEWFFYSRNLY